MKKYIILVLMLISIFLLTFNLKNIKEDKNKEISKVERLLSKPEGIEAYTLNGEKTNKEFNDLINNYVLDKITCKNGTVATYNKATNEVSLSNIHMPDYCTMNFRYTIYGRLLADNQTIKTRTDFSTTYTETNTGTLFKSTESIVGSTPKEVYYFAGNAKNNWVKFGGFYWRIIRTNHDGSVRLLYHGTSPEVEDAYISSSTVFNSLQNDSMYVGYMYGTSGSLENNRKNTNDSTIKSTIDTWYKNNLTNYTKYLSVSAVYCNDRSVSEGNYTSNENITFYYSGKKRISDNKTPSYDCKNIKDAFSVDNIEAKLTYPIALMTADEISYAGGLWATVSKAWYYYNSLNNKSTGKFYWDTITPFSWTKTYSDMYMVHSETYDGLLGTGYINSEKAVRPVISLKGNLVWKSGNGSSASPYEVEDLPPTLSETIKSYATSHTNGVYNENGYRYEGTDPSNYIYMTNKSTNEKELWRIIGVFNDGVNEEEVIRVRRHYEQGSYPTMAYDEKNTNHFPNTTMYSSLSNVYNLTNYSYTVNFKIYLGTSDSSSSLTASELYLMERGNTPGKTASDSYNNSTLFIGSVGLIYSSDYGYGVLASDCARTVKPYNYDETTLCHNNNWLFQGNNQWQRFIGPSASRANLSFGVEANGCAHSGNYVINSGAYSPVMALSKDALVNGSGTKTNPYMLVN